MTNQNGFRRLTGRYDRQSDHESTAINKANSMTAANTMPPAISIMAPQLYHQETN